MPKKKQKIAKAGIPTRKDPNDITELVGLGVDEISFVPRGANGETAWLIAKADGGFEDKAVNRVQDALEKLTVVLEDMQDLNKQDAVPAGLAEVVKLLVGAAPVDDSGDSPTGSEDGVAVIGQRIDKLQEQLETGAFSGKLLAQFIGSDEAVQKALRKALFGVEDPEAVKAILDGYAEPVAGVQDSVIKLTGVVEGLKKQGSEARTTLAKMASDFPLPASPEPGERGQGSSSGDGGGTPWPVDLSEK